MTLPQFVQRYLYRRGWKPDTYEELMFFGNMNARMLSLFLRLATEPPSNGKILFGLPPGRQFTAEEREHFAAKNAEANEKHDPARQSAEDIERLNRCSTPAMRASVTPALRSGDAYIPVWIGYNENEWYLQMGGLFSAMYADMQSHVLDRLVALDASPANPQPRKWIEYTTLLDENVRRFAEVKLYYEENFAFTIEIVSTREEPTDVRVSQSTEGHVPRG